MTILGGLLDHSLAGRLLNNLVGMPKGEGPDTAQPFAPDASDGPDTLDPSPRTDRGNHNGWQNNPANVHGNGNHHPTGGPSLPQEAGGGMKTGGPAPQGMQEVFPNIAQQLASSLSSIVSSASALANAPNAPAPHAPGIAQAAANAHAEQALANGRGQGLPVGNMPAAAATPQALAGMGPAGTLATATPTTAAASTSQAATSNAVANPASPTLAQPASTPSRAAGDTTALAQTRVAETTLPPRPENASLLSRLGTALQLGPTPATTLPALPTPPPGTTQAATTAAGLTMAASAVSPPADARGAILAVNDHAAMRADGTLTLAGHTIEGLQRRLLRNRIQWMPQRLTRLLWAMGLMGTSTSDREANPERDLQRVMQWLFWMLAVVAYGCLAVAIVALVGSNGRMFDYEAGRAYTSWLAFFGLVTGTVAWLLARRMSRRR